MALDFRFNSSEVHVGSPSPDQVEYLLFTVFEIHFRRDLKKLAENVTKEQGKTLPDVSSLGCMRICCYFRPRVTLFVDCK